MSAVLSIAPVERDKNDVSAAAAIACVAWWALAAVPSGPLGLGLAALGVAFPLIGWRLLPVMLLSSFFFHSTMALPADWLYLLRAYWLGVYFLGLLATAGMHAPRGVWLWFLGASVVLVWGLLLAAFRLGSVVVFSRSSLVDGLASFVWLSCIFVGARFYADFTADSMRRLLVTVVMVWLVSVSYGFRQLLFGFGPDTVPQDIYTTIQGVAQYEVLGRRTFTFLSANGIAIVSVLPICILLSVYRHRVGVVILTLLLAVAIWAMTLTRSFAVLLLLIVLGLWPLFRVSFRIWLSSLMLIGLAGATLVAQVGFETLAQFFRFAQLGDSTRSQIWSYTWERLWGGEALLGIGYGTAAWEEFFAELYGTKVLQSPHSAVLEFVGQFGLAGLIFYVALVGTVVKWLLRDGKRGQSVLLSAVLALVLIREQVATTYVFSPNFFSAFFWFIFGMAFAQHARGAAERNDKIGLPLK
jgi:hypothetical protein